MPLRKQYKGNAGKHRKFTSPDGSQKLGQRPHRPRYSLEVEVTTNDGQPPPCQHGFDLASNDCHLFQKSLDSVTGQLMNSGKSIIEAIHESILIVANRRPGFIDNTTTREALISVYMGYGINSILSWEAGQIEQGCAKYCAAMIIYLEDYERLESIARFINLKMRLDDTLGGGERAATLFFSKRASCSCLDEKKKRVKAHPKTSTCSVCGVVTDCKALMRCGECNTIQYCSRECQKIDWPEHKTYCRSLCLCMKDIKFSEVE